MQDACGLGLTHLHGENLEREVFATFALLLREGLVL
jgi:hypothetical protein